MIKDLIVNDINDCVFLNNNSSVYFNGSVWDTRNCGQCEIIGLLEKHRGYHIFLVKFKDGTMIKARHTNIKNGTINNPYYKNICGVACSGRVEKVSENFLYKHWQQMIYRCYDENHIKYKDYGGRGIKVDDNWLCFEYFLNDIQKLENYELLKNGRYYQLDRKNNDKNYSLANCHIVTAKENSRNRRSNVFIRVLKDEKPIDIGYLMDISYKYHIDKNTIKRRARNGLSIYGLNFQFATKKEYEDEKNKRRVG